MTVISLWLIGIGVLVTYAVELYDWYWKTGVLLPLSLFGGLILGVCSLVAIVLAGVSSLPLNEHNVYAKVLPYLWWSFQWFAVSFYVEIIKEGCHSNFREFPHQMAELVKIPQVWIGHTLVLSLLGVVARWVWGNDVISNTLMVEGLGWGIGVCWLWGFLVS